MPADAILRRLGLRQGMTMADIGCGSGFFAFPAATIVGDQGYVWGIDVSQEFVDYCKTEAQRKGVTNAAFLKSDESAAPLQDDAVDVVLLALVLHEMEKPRDYLDEVRRILKPGGKVFIIEWQKKEMPHGPAVAERFSPEDIASMVSRLGMSIEAQFEVNEKHYALVAG